MTRQKEQEDYAEKTTRGEIGTGNQMTALGFKTGGRHQTSLASLWGPEGERVQLIIFEEVLVMCISCDLDWTDRFPQKDVMQYLIMLSTVARAKQTRAKCSFGTGTPWKHRRKRKVFSCYWDTMEMQLEQKGLLLLQGLDTMETGGRTHFFLLWGHHGDIGGKQRSSLATRPGHHGNRRKNMVSLATGTPLGHRGKERSSLATGMWYVR